MDLWTNSWFFKKLWLLINLVGFFLKYKTPGSLMKSIWLSGSRKLERSVLCHVASIGKLWSMGQIWPLAYFCTAHELKKWFSCVYMFVGKIKRWVTFCDTWKFYETQSSVSVNKIFLEHSHMHLSTVRAGAGAVPVRPRRAWAVAAEFVCGGLLPPTAAWRTAHHGGAGRTLQYFKCCTYNPSMRKDIFKDEIHTTSLQITASVGTTVNPS